MDWRKQKWQLVGNSTIQSVVAPDGLQVIGTRAFADCANLKCITLPDSVSYIAEDAFENTPDVVIFASVGSYAWQRTQTSPAGGLRPFSRKKLRLRAKNPPNPP